MTADTLLEQALQLPPEERELLCEQIWRSLDPHAGTAHADISLTPEQEKELKRRITDYEANPDNVVDWEDMKAEIFEKRGLRL